MGSRVANSLFSASTPACGEGVRAGWIFPRWYNRRCATVFSPSFFPPWPGAARSIRSTSLPAGASEAANPAADVPTIAFQLGFAGTSGADAAAQPGESPALSGQPGEEILQLCQLHLEPALGGVRPARRRCRESRRSGPPPGRAGRPLGSYVGWRSAPGRKSPDPPPAFSHSSRSSARRPLPRQVALSGDSRF